MRERGGGVRRRGGKRPKTEPPPTSPKRLLDVNNNYIAGRIACVRKLIVKTKYERPVALLLVGLVGGQRMIGITAEEGKELKSDVRLKHTRTLFPFHRAGTHKLTRAHKHASW